MRSKRRGWDDFFKLGTLVLVSVVVSTGCMEPPGWKGEAATREYDIPGNGVLRVDVPEELVERVDQDEEKARLSIVYGGRGDDPVMSFGVMPDESGDPDSGKPSTIRRRIENSLSDRDPMPEIRALENGKILGYYYIDVDKRYKPGPGEYKYLLNGEYRIGELKVRFSVLTNNPDSPAVERALTALAGATINRDAGWSSKAVARTYEVPGHGVLRMSVPAAVTVRIENIDDKAPLKVDFGVRPDDPVMFINMFPGDPDDADFNSPERIRRQVLRGVREPGSGPWGRPALYIFINYRTPMSGDTRASAEETAYPTYPPRRYSGLLQKARLSGLSAG